MIQYATDENFDTLIANGDVIVDFFGVFCGPCKEIGAVLEDLNDEFPFLNIVKVDTDECEKVTERFGIEGIPDLYFYKNGKMVHREIGAIGEDELRSHISRLIYQI